MFCKYYLCIITKSIQLAGFAFVDDTDLCVTLQPEEQTTIQKNAKGGDSLGRITMSIQRSIDARKVLLVQDRF